MKPSFITLLAYSSFGLATATQGAVLYSEEFDGNTNGYNVNSTTAMVGDNDWVDFSNRINSDSLTTASGGSESVLAGTSASNDPQVRSDFGFGIDKADVESFVLRIRIDKDNANGFDDTLVNGDFTVFWGSTSYVNPGATNIGDTNFNLGNPTTLVTQSNGWHLATWNIPVGGLTAGANPNLESARIDPTNLAAGNGDSWEIDYFTINGVPEPSSALLIALGGLAMGIRRRRH
ncbi:PEP-CTERM sorting domain-containing protein [Haloferula sp.]|uniref:PEP-CTERM sorting domain-containing protein n=1 Tax=Haloferula sp. TaxID=2497595 RepID=UPI0032A0AD62